MKEQPTSDQKVSEEKIQLLAELVEYMDACALIARNGADIYPKSKELRHHAKMLSAAAACLTELLERAKSVPDKVEVDIWPIDYRTAQLCTDAQNLELDYGAFGGEPDEYSLGGRQS